MSILSKLMSKFDDKEVVQFSKYDPFSEVNNWVSTGDAWLDFNLETLGVPPGVIEIRGPSRSGKTTLGLAIIKSLLDASPDEAVVNILSSERRDNELYARQIGVKTELVAIHKIRTIKQVFIRIEQVIKETEELMKLEKEKFKPKYLFLWDSLGGTTSEAEMKTASENAARLKGSKEDKKQKVAPMASAARELAEGMRYLNARIYDNDVTLIIINHTYDDTNSSNGGQVSYGGKKIEYMPTMRLDIKKGYPVGYITVGEDKKKIGQVVDVTPIKNDFSSNMDKIQIEIGFGFGIVLSPEDIKFGIENDILLPFGQSGAKYAVGKKVILEWKNRTELYKLYEAKNPVLKLITKKLISTAHNLILEKRAQKKKQK